MSLISEKIFLEKTLPSILGAKILNSQKTRLGGSIIHLLTTSQKEAFVKIGTGYEKIEIIREYKNISALQGYLPVPKIYDYISKKDQVIIVLEKMPGMAFHNMVSSLGHQSSLLLIKSILNAFYDVPNSVKENFEIGISHEIKDIKYLIDNNKIREDNFIKDSKGFSPEKAFDKIQNDLKKHTTQTLSHGDFCLPNILITPKGKWSLIDWGKGGLGDPCRDLSALKGSLKKNMNKEAFSDLCKIMNIEVTLDFQKKINLYKLMDLFWYNAIL